MSIKDLFDIAGDTTTAGSVVLRNAPPATRDATAVGRLKAAGLVPIGRTNMTEFAFSGLGINPHYGTPLKLYDRKKCAHSRASSSGAAISVTDGMAIAALGTDTGGSCRIPAAQCGLVGYKPTAKRVPLDGVVPLSTSLDSVGPIAASVACCAALDAILAGEKPRPLAIPRGFAFRRSADNGLRRHRFDVSHAFTSAQTKLSSAGVRITDIPLTELAELGRINSKSGFGAAESYAFHRPLLSKAARYDLRVLSRIARPAPGCCRL